MHNLTNSSPTLTNVIFAGNQADTSGGGVFNFGGSSPTLTNVIFSGNSAVEDGGGMYNNNSSSPILTGVTFSGNRAQSDGGAIYNESDSNATIQNSILWNNQDSSGTGTATSSLVNNPSTPVIRYSLVQGCNPGGAWTSSCGTDAGNNLADVDPLLVAPVNPASAPTTGGNLRLQTISPAVNAGDNALIPGGVTTDLAGNARIQQGTVDLGAYEVHPIFVDHTATGAATGVSWTDAFTTVQDALAIAQSGAEIWVATGVYTPGTARTDSFVLQYQMAIYGGFAGTETILEQRNWETNVTVLSGDIDGNDIVDANGVVTETANIQGNNTYHVVTADANNGMSLSPISNYGTAILDGFTITGGSANGSGADRNGGGFYNYIAFPTLRNITFQGNQAVNGGGMFIYNSGPALTNVIFRNNSVTGYGGGIFAAVPSANVATTLINVLFEGNSALQGGGMAIDNTEGPQLINVTFANNDALQGGGLYNANSPIADSATLHNSILWGNTASSGGNQIYNQGANPTLHYTLFANGGNDVSGSPNNPASSNNLNSDPLFVDPVGSDFRLAAISPAVNAGDNAQIPGDVTTDLAGHARIQQGTVDMGAFEVQPGDYQSVCRSGLAEGETYIFASTGVTATVDTLGSLSELCVTLSQSNHPDAPNGLQTGLYWTITRTASSEDWSLTLSALLTDTLATTDRLCRYSGTIWECGDAQNHSIDGNRITRSSVTQLSAWAVGSLAPTAATVDGFAAALHPDRVRLHWTTLNEVGLTGFHLYRGTDAAGPGDRITGDPLPSQGAGGLDGFAYAYDDFTPRPPETAFYYWLEELHSDGEVFRHGPQRIGGAGSLRVFLPAIAAGGAAADAAGTAEALAPGDSMSANPPLGAGESDAGWGAFVSSPDGSQSFSATDPAKLYEATFRGGVVTGGYSPGILTTPASGSFTVSIPAGSTIRRAYLLAGRLRNAPDITVTLNDLSYAFNGGNTFTSGSVTVYGDAAVHAIDVTADIDPATTTYTITVPGQPTAASDKYPEFYLYIAFDNNTLPLVTSAIFANTVDMYVADKVWPLTTIAPIPTTHPVGLAVFGGFANNTGDDESVTVNGVNIGTFSGMDFNAGSVYGAMAGFQYYNQTLTGYGDDNADQAMSGPDALSNIQALIPNNTTTIPITFTDTAGAADNNIWAVILTASSSAPTAAAVGGFEANQQADHVQLLWQTFNEVGLYGFHLYRGTDAAGPGERLTGELVAAQGAGGLEGFAYAYEDFTPRPAQAAVFYWLEEVHSDGARFRHGPQQIGGPNASRVFLPLVDR
jgi:predicted outer membrane repeat protein